MARFKWDSRESGLKPEYFPNVEVIFMPNMEDYDWAVFDNGKQKKVYTVKEQTSKRKHLYVNVEMVVNGEVYKNRGMPLAQLIWLKELSREIVPGCVIDHINEDPLDNRTQNLQMLSIGNNVRKSAIYRRKQK